MVRLARRLLMIATVAGGILITAGRATQGAPLAGEEKYKLIARVETLIDNLEGRHQLTLTLRNESWDVIYIVERVPSRDFKLEIKDDSGKAVRPKDNPLQGFVVDEGKHSIVPVDPGQQVSYVIDLDSLYSLASREYILTAARTILLGDKLTTVNVKSPPVRFGFLSSK
jgi:hypothetical protein